MTDRADQGVLIARVLAGDMGAARALYDAHVDRVYRVAARIVGDDERARDCTQEAFVRAFRKLAQFRGDSALATWLHAIAVAVALDEAKRLRLAREREADLDDAAGSAERGEAGGFGAEPDLKARMARAIDALPEIYRTVFVMYDVEGYTHPEIGAALGLPVGTSKARLSHARARLREALADFVLE